MRRVFGRLLGHRRLAALGGVVVVLGGTVGVLATRGSASQATYRTAQAVLGTVTQTVTASGTLEPSGSTGLDFTTSGRVSAVDVTAGQAVAAGQTLATLDTASLAVTVAQANSSLTTAAAKLATDQAGPTAQSLAAANAQVATARTQLAADQTNLADTEAVNQQALQADEDAVTTATSNNGSVTQATVTADQNTASAALTVMNQACNTSPPAAACATDQATYNADEKQFTTDQGTLAALNNADLALTTEQVHLKQSNDQATAQVAAAEVTLSNATASLSTASIPATASQISQDQAGVTAAQAELTLAQQSLSAATLTAPVAGTVAQVNVIANQNVSGGVSASTATSTVTHSILLTTPGTFEVDASVSDANISAIAAGEAVRVTPSGATQALVGTVSSIAVEASTTSGVTTVPVVASVSGVHTSLRAGTSAELDVVVHRAVNVVTVPTSAVHTTGGGSTVQTCSDATCTQAAQTISVTVGASDASNVEITAGVNPGDYVVIAQVNAAVPSNGGGSTTRGGTGRGGFGGGGLVAP